MPLGLILPRSAEERKRVLKCLCCGRPFPMDQDVQFVRHVKACSKRNEDQIEATIAEGRSDHFRHPADEEMYRHFRRGGN